MDDLNSRIGLIDVCITTKLMTVMMLGHVIVLNGMTVLRRACCGLFIRWWRTQGRDGTVSALRSIRHSFM